MLTSKNTSLLILLTVSIFCPPVKGRCEERPRSSLATDSEHAYTGKLISLDLQDTTLQSAFHILAQVSGLNILVNSDVRGRVTLKLDNVPWDQAFDTIIKTYNLHYKRDGNIISISAPHH